MNGQWSVIDVNVGQVIAKVNGISHNVDVIGVLKQEGIVIGIHNAKKRFEFYNINL